LKRVNIFWSHIQLEEVLNPGTLYKIGIKSQHAGIDREARGQIPSWHKQVVWLAYFCIRQCQNNFVVQTVVPLIKDIGALIATVDLKINERKLGAAFKNGNYLQRSFYAWFVDGRIKLINIVVFVLQVLAF
jgi:hypothetical protein